MPAEPSTVLASPLRLPCGATLPNRIVKPALTEGLADDHDRANGRHEALYRRWSEGGAGTLITGNVMIDRRFLERPGNVVVEDERSLHGLQAWACAGREGGNHLWMQISHPGRQCTRFVTAEPLAPSAVKLRLGGLFGTPRAMREGEIIDVIARFARTAHLAKRADFTGVQVHAAHGYLLSEFLSPRVNQRADRWGGSLENRARLLREVVRAVREEVGADFPVAVKLNSSDFQKGGFSLDEACQVARWLVDEGIDLLEVSGGTYENPRLLGIGGDAGGERAPTRAESTIAREAYFLDHARAMRKAVEVPLMVTGGFRTKRAMEAALGSGALDAIGLGRPLCTEPDLPRFLIEGNREEARADERHLSLAAGFLGPASASPTVRALNAQAQSAWYYQQILALAAGEAPDLALSAPVALSRHWARELRTARARVR